MADLEGFETFTRRLVPLGKTPQVTIQKRGLFSFNKAAYTALGRPEAVELLFNAQARIIAIRAVEGEVAHGYKFRSLGGQQRKDPSTFLLGATAFTSHYNIPTDKSVRRSVEIEDGVLFVDLKDEGTVVIGTRSKDREDAQADSPDKDQE